MTEQDPTPHDQQPDETEQEYEARLAREDRQGEELTTEPDEGNGENPSP